MFYGDKNLRAGTFVRLHMVRGLSLILLGGVLCGIALVKRGWMFGFAWIGLNFLAVGVAHFLGAHGLFGKRRDGTLPWWSWVLFFSLHVYALAVLKLAILFGREAKVCPVCDDLFVGARPGGRDSASDFVNVVDLTAEFQEARAFRERAGYLCFPVLDACAPAVEDLEKAVARVSDGGVTFVHCAQGHGRTGLFAACWLIANRRARTGDEALEMLRKARPGIRLNARQRECVLEFQRRCEARRG
jgi:protein-tyrosine phosphatase